MLPEASNIEAIEISLGSAWTHIFDFGLSDGGFFVPTTGHYHVGLGWEWDTFGVGIKKFFDASFGLILTVEWTFVINLGTSDSVHNENWLEDVNHTVINPTDTTTQARGIGTYIRINSNFAIGFPNASYLYGEFNGFNHPATINGYISKCVVTGFGFDPF